MAEAETPVFSSTASTTSFDITLPAGLEVGDDVVIAISYFWNRILTWEATTTTLLSVDIGSIDELRIVRRVIDGTEGATFNVLFNSSTAAEAYATVVTDVDFAAQGSLVYSGEAKPRMYLPLTEDSLTTDEKLWVFFGWHTDGAATMTPVAGNMVNWSDYAEDKADDWLFFASQVTSVQSLVGSGDFPYWNSSGGFENLMAVAIYWDTTEPPPPEPDPEPEVPASSGASDADLGVRRSRSSGAARRRIIDPDDRRRKYPLGY